MQTQSTAPRGFLPALEFGLAGILPADRRLLLDLETHTAILLTVFPSPLWLHSFSLTPSATRAFLALLQAYPQHCSYASLFAALYPAPSRSRQWEHGRELELIIPPIRRALKALLPTLRGCGLRALSLRNQGYLLAAANQQPDPFQETEKSVGQAEKVELETAKYVLSAFSTSGQPIQRSE